MCTGKPLFGGQSSNSLPRDLCVQNTQCPIPLTMTNCLEGTFFELGIYCMFDGTFGVWRITPKALNVSYNSFSSISGSRFPMKILAPTSRFLLCADAWKQISWKLTILPEEYNTHSDGQGWEKKMISNLSTVWGHLALHFCFWFSGPSSSNAR